MERIRLTQDLDFSRIVYGMWRIGDDADTSPAHVEAKIQACLDQGITTFDQADIYGGYEAEAVLGEALRANPALRSQMQIVTKCDIVAPMGRHADRRVKYYDTSRAHIEASVDHSLKAMGIDEIDLLLIHRPDPLMDHFETGAALDDLVASGKVPGCGGVEFQAVGLESTAIGDQNPACYEPDRDFSGRDFPLHQWRYRVPPATWSCLDGMVALGGRKFDDRDRGASGRAHGCAGRPPWCGSRSDCRGLPAATSVENHARSGDEQSGPYQESGGCDVGRSGP